MSLRDQMKADAKEIGVGSSRDYLTFSEDGVYRMRILSPLIALGKHFFGKGTPPSVCYGEQLYCPYHSPEIKNDLRMKYHCYVVDRNDGQIKFAELPVSVVSSIADYEVDSDYKFDSYPMPYDIKITVKKADPDPKNKYKTLAVPTREVLTDDELLAFAAKDRAMKIDEYVHKKKKEQFEAHGKEGIYQAEKTRRETLAANKPGGSVPETPTLSPTSRGGIEYPVNPGDEPAF